MPEGLGGVAVTGIGVISAAGAGVAALASVQRQAKGLAVEGACEALDTGLELPVCHVDNDFLEDECMELACGRFPNRTCALLFRASVDALRMAGITTFSSIQGIRVGISVGTTVGATFNNESCYFDWKDNGRIDLEYIYQFHESNLALWLHSVLGTSGPSVVVANACSSGTDAIGIAYQWIRDGRCDMAVAGGADELSRIALNGFNSLQLTSSEPAMPFDVNRNGLNLGEGAGVLVLEDKDRVNIRNVSPVAFVLGYGASSDAWHPTAPEPEGRGLQSALKDALREAHLTPSCISVINAHGTGTRANDAAEARAISAVFKDVRPPVYSIKGLLGHTLGAAGGIEAVSLIQTLKDRMVLGTPGCREPEYEDIAIASEGWEKEISGPIGISQSLAFGGGNSALVIEGC